ncbi:MAG: LemA family protein [Acidobacteriota bacterium]|jgi:LemA protein
MNKTVLGCGLGAVVGLLLLVGIVVLYLVGAYNGLVAAEQSVVAQWAQVENVYQRRADLVPNLVSTVRGAAEFEQQTLQNVVDARARVGQMQVSPEILNDPQRFAQFEQAQDQLSSALSRLLVVVERYPELRAVAAFQDLMTQLEGTENRITVERMRFNEAARQFNTRVKKLPQAWLISTFGWPFEEKAYFQSRPGAEEAPEVEFDFGAE